MCNARKHPAAAGGNWIRREKRLAIYLRDGGACAYCGESFVEGARLELDHIQPWSMGGSNDQGNLITACKRCNAARGNREVEEFVASVADYIQDEAQAILGFIEQQRNTPLDVAAAKAILSRARTLPAAYEQAMR